MSAITEHVLTKEKAAVELGISVATLDRRTRAGMLVPHRQGRNVVYRIADIEQAKLTARTFTSQPDIYWLTPAYLKQAREEAGLSQHDLARLSGVSRSKIANFETGVTVPSLDDALDFYRPLEQRGSFNALRALIGITGTNRDIIAATMRAIEREADAIIERQTLTQNLLDEQEQEMQRFMGKLVEERGE